MYNLSLFSSNISQNNTIFSLYGLMIDANLIEHPTIFCDNINLPIKVPVLNTFHLMAANHNILCDNSVYDMAETYVSNRFICIDIPSRHEMPNVDHYSIEPFVQNQKVPEKLLELLHKILSQEKYNHAKV